MKANRCGHIPLRRGWILIQLPKQAEELVLLFCRKVRGRSHWSTQRLFTSERIFEKVCSSKNKLFGAVKICVLV